MQEGWIEVLLWRPGLESFFFFFLSTCLFRLDKHPRRGNRFVLEISISEQFQLTCDFGRESLE